uniref:Uncharacterized protein n=1 Tax=Arundo donax TaxID=35708 RepID=A0A0A9FLG1_ARUDO
MLHLMVCRCDFISCLNGSFLQPPLVSSMFVLCLTQS